MSDQNGQGDLFGRRYVSDAQRSAAMRRLIDLMYDEGLGDSKIFRAFCQFHGENPRVLRLLERFTCEIAARRRHYGIQAIFERMRWEMAIQTAPDEEGFKINNNFAAYYARLLELIFPELAEQKFFRCRKLGPTYTQHRAPDEDPPF